MLCIGQFFGKFTRRWHLKLFCFMIVAISVMDLIYRKVPLDITHKTDDCFRNLEDIKPSFQLSTSTINVTSSSDGMCPDTRCAKYMCHIKVQGFHANKTHTHMSLKINGNTKFSVSGLPGIYIATLAVGCSHSEVHRFTDDINLVRHLRSVKKGATLVGCWAGGYFPNISSLQVLSEIVGVNLDGVSTGGVLSFVGKAGFPVFSNVTWEKQPVMNHTYTYYIGKDVIPSMESKSWDELITLHQLQKGGNYIPPNCIPRYKIAIIIPFRQRYEHLKVLINNLVPFLKTQMLAFTLFIVDQEEPVLFNRAALMNIGYIEATKLSKYDCYVFHDVDLMPIDLCNSYYCGEIPRHLCVVNNKHKYKTTYLGHFGGANIMNDYQMKTLNGYSNRFYGWGKEDDEMYARTADSKLGFVQQPPIIGRYYMLNHQTDKGNPKRPTRFTLKQAYANAKYYNMDGLSTISYHLHNITFKPMYTHIRVEIPGPISIQELDQYMNLIGQNPKAKEI